VSRAEFAMPWLPSGEMVRIDGRGEFFVRRHRHPDPDAPTVLLLHGWTASADLQFFSAYEALARMCSFVALDHQGHGRGLRSPEPFTLEAVADDSAVVARRLGIEQAIVVGYSMGGPLALNLARRHPDFVQGIVMQATALEWRATLRERVGWKLLPLMGSAMRSWLYPRTLRRATRDILPDGHELARFRPWLDAETMRSSPFTIVEAGRALASFDARPWASELGVPAASLIMTRDRMVKPHKQRALAAALNATVRELRADHLGPVTHPDQFASLTVELIDAVLSASS
jgi:3-oxoadipate enol-lactonase